MTAITPRTVPEFLDDVASRSPDDEAFVHGDQRITWSELALRAATTASVFAELGVRSGSVVSLKLPSGIDYAVCYHAAMRRGAITSGINLRLGPDEILSIERRTAPALTVVEDGAAVDDPAVIAIAALRTAALGAVAAQVGPDVTPSSPVAIVWTSGTTGAPKGAVFDHENLRAVHDGIGALSARGDRRLSPLPFAHVGFMTRPWDELGHRITTIIAPAPWRARETLQLLSAERVTVAQGVPTQWTLMLADPAFEGFDPSHLRLAGIGGSTVPAELVREIRTRLRCPVVVRYTSTEAALTTGTRPGDPDELVATTVGAAAPGVEVRVVDRSGRAAPVGEVGVVQCRSAAVMREYWADPVASAAALVDGWLTTGDLGYLDDAGYLTLVGRRNEMYVRGGYNVYPTEVEAALGSHPGVDRVAVAGASDSVLGEIGVAWVVPSPAGACGRPPTLDDLRAHCRARLADYKAPDAMIVVDHLPLTAMQKVDKQQLLASLERAGRRNGEVTTS